MRNKIIKIVAFITLLIITLLVESRIVMPKNNTEKAGIHDYEANGILAEDENTIDLIILGDSEAFTSIIPMQIWNDYGYTSYVCCSPAQTMPESITFLIKALKKQKPKMIILEASNIYNGSERDEHIQKVLEYTLPVFEYHNRWKTIKKEELFEDINYDVINDLKGYHFTKSIVKASLNDKMNPTDEVNIIPRSNKLYIKLLKKYCKSNDIELLILRTPTTYSWDYKSYNGVKEFTDKEKIEYVDMNLLNDEVKIDWERDSKDGGDHLNHFGAIKTTKYVENYLYEKNILIDHRNDEKYNSWNNSYKNYLEIVK